MGLHQDRDEADFASRWCRSRSATTRCSASAASRAAGTTESVRLRSGDVAVLAGAARLAHHGIDRVYPGTSTLLPQGGRINLTMRVVTA